MATPTFAAARCAFDLIADTLWSDEKKHMESELDFDELHEKHPDLGFDAGCLADCDLELLARQIAVIDHGNHAFACLVTVTLFMNAQTERVQTTDDNPCEECGVLDEEGARHIYCVTTEQWRCRDHWEACDDEECEECHEDDDEE